MSIKVQASRFAVLRVEDDDDSDEKDTKAKQPTNKAGQQLAEGKKKAKKKKKAEQLKHETEELRNLAFCKVGKKGSSHSTARSGPVSDSQWEEWQQKNEENSLQEFDKDLHDALLLSKLEFEQKERLRDGEAARSTEQGGEGRKSKKKGKGAAIHVDRSDHEDAQKQRGSRDQVQVAASSLSGQGDTVATLNVTSKSTEKTSKLNKSQEELPKKAAVQKLSVKDVKESILQKEEEIKQLREINKKIEADVAEVKKKNQQFYLMLGRGEELNKAVLIAELEAAQQTRDTLTEQVAQCSSELEKERSKSHALKAEREKLKSSKQHCGK